VRAHAFYSSSSLTYYQIRTSSVLTFHYSTLRDVTSTSVSDRPTLSTLHNVALVLLDASCVSLLVLSHPSSPCPDVLALPQHDRLIAITPLIPIHFT